MQCCAVQYSVYSIVYSVGQCSAVQCSTVYCSAVVCDKFYICNEVERGGGQRGVGLILVFFFM